MEASESGKRWRQARRQAEVASEAASDGSKPWRQAMAASQAEVKRTGWQGPRDCDLGTAAGSFAAGQQLNGRSSSVSESLIGCQKKGLVVVLVTGGLEHIQHYGKYGKWMWHTNWRC